jgi:tyrosyl-tRNA synthetase
MYGKVMSVPDNLIAPYYKLCTEIPLATIHALVHTLAEGANPRDSKASLAREIVRQYHGEAAALKAEDAWNATYRDKQGPSADQIETVKLKRSQTVLELLTGLGVASSNSEARRLLAQNGVRIDGDTITDETTKLTGGELIQVGKRRFFKLEGK